VTQAILKDRSLQLLVVVGIVALLINVVFYLTYPINIGQSDNATYVRMIALGSSNLMHASGYPAVLYFLSHRIMPAYSSPIYVANDINNRWFSTLQRIQLLLHLALFTISIVLCAKVFGKPAATILALGWGCNALFISNVNATAPEWLQGHAMLLSVLTHAYARKTVTGKKAWVYCLGAAVFALAYLIKPNSLLLAICLAAFLLFDKKTWRFKILQGVASAAIFLLLTSAFAHTFHYKATGTTQLNFDHAWVLTGSLPTDYVSAAPERLGIHSLQWAALARVTPPDYSRAGGIENINFGAPPEIRQKYVEHTAPIFRMSREELIEFVKNSPLPDGFKPWLASTSLYYFYGLEKTDALGIQVYMEALRSHPGFYLRKMRNAGVGFFLNGMKTIQTFPTLSDPIRYKFLPPDFSRSVFGESTIVPPADRDRYVLEYYNPRETVSYYGVRVIEAVNKVTAAGWLYLALHTAALAGLFKLKSDMDKITALSLLAALLAFISASSILLGLRQKELIAMAPLYFLFVSIGLVGAAGWWSTLRSRYHRERKP
jgi:hypothetical protein